MLVQCFFLSLATAGAAAASEQWSRAFDTHAQFNSLFSEHVYAMDRSSLS